MRRAERSEVIANKAVALHRLDESDRAPAAELKICIAMALTYHPKRA